MSYSGTPNPRKYCFIYCGDDACNCGASTIVRSINDSHPKDSDEWINEYLEHINDAIEEVEKNNKKPDYEKAYDRAMDILRLKKDTKK
jgi:hypothetical protein